MPQTLHHTLDNGLAILLRPLQHVGTVSTWLFYHVGARNEPPGQTGISHWVEHMAFKGTPTFGKGEIARLVNRHGGLWNGLTNHDWTTYFETLPAEHLDLALRIEADRMANVRFDPAEVDAERTVVLAEREGSENDPSYLLHEEVAAAALRVHPYRQPVIGWKEDLRRISREELLQHYRTHYVPNNATLVLAGAFRAAGTRARIAELFGGLPAGPSLLQPSAVEPPQQAERRLVLRRPGPTPILEVAFPAPRVADPGFAPFLVLDAVLGGAKSMAFFGGGTSTHRSARLYRALVETELALSVRSGFSFSLDPGIFTIRAFLRAGRSPEAVEPPLLAELQRLIGEPPDPEEIARTARQVRAQLAYGSESTTSQGYWLGSLALVDRPERLDTLLEEVTAVRPEDVQRVAASYLTPEKRTVGWFLPEERPTPPVPAASSSTPAVPARVIEKEKGRRRGTGARRGKEADRTCPLPASAVHRRIVPAGTILLQHENRAHPLAAVQGYLSSGSLADPVGQEGLAQLTAQMLARGTSGHSFRELNELLEGRGAGIEFSTGPYTLFFNGKALAEDLPVLLGLLIEMLREPAFPQAEWQRLRGETLTRLRYLEDDPDYVANVSFRELLYPEGHPLRRRTEGSAKSVAALAVEDLVAFHRGHLHPAGLVVAISGAVDLLQVEEHLAGLLAGWEGAPPPSLPPVPRVLRPHEVRRVNRPIPGKSQASLVLGFPGPARTDPDYYAALLANVVLGQLGLMGRLGAAVRDVQGLAYSVHSVLEAGPETGTWSVRAGIAPAYVERAAAGIRAEIGRFLEQGPTDEELADTVAYLTGQLPLGLETNDGVAANLLVMERFALGLDFIERYPAILAQVTREEIVRAARQYLSADEYALAVAGPTEG